MTFGQLRVLSCKLRFGLCLDYVVHIAEPCDLLCCHFNFLSSGSYHYTMYDTRCHDMLVVFMTLTCMFTCLLGWTLGLGSRTCLVGLDRWAMTTIIYCMWYLGENIKFCAYGFKF